MKKEIIKKLKKIKLFVLDFDGVMTDNKVIVGGNGKEFVMCNREDGLGLEILKKQTDIEVIVLSKEQNKVVPARCKKLSIKCVHGIDDKITILKNEARKRNLSFDNVCFIGNDINDIECIKEASVGIAVADSHPRVLKVANLVTTKKGGDGAVREVCDWILSGGGD